ncbi:MAG TPA: PIG-L family deacetylase [Rhodanobacteraceae bacterium]
MILHELAHGRAIDAPVAVVVAHPDDETLGVGARIACLHRLTLIHLTDGAPRSLSTHPIEDAKRCATLSARRARELACALEILQATPQRSIAYGYPDQESVLHLPGIVTRLRDDLADVRFVLTHPYEHGHPDHDTAALAVRMACALLAKVSDTAPMVIEFPSYHARAHDACFGRFWHDRKHREHVAILDNHERERKARALACFASQREMLQNFPAGVERFRRAPDYDFSKPAPPPLAWYDAQHWPIDSHAWRQLAQRGMREIGVA